MRVLYLLRYFPTLTETFVNQEIMGVHERGVQVAVASMGARADGALQDELPEVPVHRLSRGRLARWLPDGSPGARWLATHQRPKDVSRLAALRRLARGFDRVHVHFAGEAAELAHALSLDTGLPYTVTAHAVDLFRPRPSLPEVLGRAARVLVPSDHHVRWLAERGLAATRLRCGPDLRRWPRLPLPDGPLALLSVARDRPKKGLDLLEQAWARGRPDGARLTLVSDREGPALPGLTRLPLCPPSELRAHMARCHAVVLPCRVAPDGDRDGVPLVLMEALASGRAVISAAVSGLSELVDPRVGWLLPPEDVTALAGCLRALTPAACAERGARGPDHLVEHGFTLDHQVRGLLRAWGHPDHFDGDDPSGPG